MAFNGRATYDDFPMIGQDISDILLLLSPTETPVLDLLPQAPRAATSTKHTWREIALGPDYLTASTAVNSATAATGIQINGLGAYLQVGMILELDADAGNQELVQITSIPGPNSILVSRNYGSTGINSLAPGGQIAVIATAEPEGEDLAGDVSRPRTERENYTHIFKKPITISGTDRSVLYLPDTGDELTFQTANRALELARDLEKAVLRSVSVNTIGSNGVRRSMSGLRHLLSNINSTVANNSFTTDPLLYINDGLQNCWNAGARDIDLLIAGDDWKRSISGTNAAKLFIEQQDTSVNRIINFIATDFGAMRVVLTPWLPGKHIMGIATRRTYVTPLRGRSFQREDLAKTGDSSKAHIVGEYTLEVHHPDKMFQTRVV